MTSNRDQPTQVNLRKALGDFQRWHRLLITGLAALLFTINIALVQHQYNFELHAAGDSCKICLEAHAIGHGVVEILISAALPWTSIVYRYTAREIFLQPPYCDSAFLIVTAIGHQYFAVAYGRFC